ncbi:hypothetical protein BJY04DRAFT_215051 [Aspergillus karnatakaensis]|uniref:uncharacterized protein n=1 Tax=Aspergillus karnatakaensis TaxID=1810916 RepID=UPI003CCD95B8
MGQLGGGFTAIYGPDRRKLMEDVAFDWEGILYAELYMNEIAFAKSVADPVGHYNRPDLFQLKVDTKRKEHIIYENVAVPAPTDMLTRFAVPKEKGDYDAVTVCKDCIGDTCSISATVFIGRDNERQAIFPPNNRELVHQLSPAKTTLRWPETLLHTLLAADNAASGTVLLGQQIPVVFPDIKTLKHHIDFFHEWQSSGILILAGDQIDEILMD